MKWSLMRVMVAVAAGVLCLSAAANAEARPGELVRGFGEGGILRVDASASPDSSGATVAVDSADRIVLLAGGGGELVRLLPPGLPDHSFGDDGRVTLPDGTWESLALDPAGRIVVAGSVNRDLAVARYLPDGTPDASFSGDGLATLHVEPPPPKPIAPGVDRPPTENPPLEKLNRVAVDSDGSVVALGEIRNCFHGLDQCYLESNLVARFDPHGAVDAGFGGGAVVLDLEALSTGSPGQVGAEFGRLALQPDGKVLIGGTNGFKLALLRLTTAGAFDPGFAGDGVFTTRLDTLSEREVLEIGMAKAILARADGRIVVVGERTLLGLEPDGELDPSFGRKGSAPVEPPALFSAIAIPEGATFDRTGRIIVVGRDSSGSVVLRYFTRGRPDPRFARGGYAGLDLTRADFSEAEEEAPAESLTDVALSSEGDVLAAGVVKPRERSPRRLLAVARYDGSDGQLAYCEGKLAVLQGTPGPDRVASVSGPVVTFGGDDRIAGSRGLICAGAGDDVLRAVGGQVDAGPGDDRVLVNFGGARVFGRAGDDELRTVRGEASVSLSGGSGADLLVGSASRDLLYGGDGADRLFGHGGRDRLLGGLGDDFLVGAGGTDRLFGGPGRNRLLPGPDGPPQVVYRGERPSLRISLVVRPGYISGLHIDVEMPCRDGEVLYSSSSWDDYEIPIRPDGSFAYHETRGWNSEHLRGRLVGDRIVGTYREASGMGRNRCITGYPGKQQLRFVARRGP
jgi:uncharacterized delta-60 repeat protein